MSGLGAPEAKHDEPMEDRVSFRIPEPLLERVDGWVEDGLYASRAVAIRDAIRGHQPEGGD